MRPGAWRRVFITRNYVLFMGGSFFSALGSWFQAVAIGWLVLDLTDSPFVLGLANFMQMAPLFALGLFGGVLADRMDRRHLLLAGMGVGTAATSLLAALALAGAATVPAILGASLVLGLTNAVVWPAWQPFIKDLVPTERLREAIAFNSARFNLTRVLGPALAGLLMGSAGAPLCLLVAALSSACVLGAIWLIRRPAVVRARPDPWFSAAGEGLDYVRRDGFALRLLAITGVFGVLVMPYQAFLPAFARDVLEIGATGLGVLLAAVGAGAVAGALFAGSALMEAQPGQAMAWTALLAGAGLAAFAGGSLFPGVRLAAGIAALAVLGLGSTAYLTAASSTLQLRVPEALVGRVMGLWVVMNAGTTPLGSLALGGIAERFGLPPVLFWCGVAGIGLGAAALLARSFDGSPRPLATMVP